MTDIPPEEEIASEEPADGRIPWRLIAFGLAGVAAMWLGFIGVGVVPAEAFVRRAGYHVMLVTFALTVFALFRQRRRHSRLWPPLSRGRALCTGAAIAGFSLLAINSEPYQSKVLNDEFVLQATAYNMHYFREVTTMARGYDLLGVFVTMDGYLDKRPYFYPFLVTLLHDLTGYRTENAFVLNSLLFPGALWLAFLIGRRLADWRGGMLAVVLLGTLPLLGQNATGSGMELLNVFMILAALLLGSEYLRSPGETTLLSFLLVVVLLAESRYESALFVGPAALVVLAGWWRCGRIVMPWLGCLVPLMLVPCALHQKVVSNTPLLWELKDRATSRFSIQYFAGNFHSALEYLLGWRNQLSNSPLLSIAGLLAACWIAWRLFRRRPSLRQLNPSYLALAAFSAGMLINTLLVFCYYWSSFGDPMACRFALPLHLVLTFSVVVAAHHADRRLPATLTLLAAGLVVALPLACSRFDYHHYSRLGVEQIEWDRRFFNARNVGGERLIISNNSTLPWLLEKRPAILIGRAPIVADRIAYQLGQPTFREILVLQALRPTTAEGDYQIVPDDLLPKSFRLQTLVERRFGTKICRISRLVAIDPAPPAADPADGPGISQPAAFGAPRTTAALPGNSPADRRSGHASVGSARS